MKVIEKESVPVVEFRAFRMSSKNFLEIVEKYAKPDLKFELTVGTASSETRFVFDSVDDVRENLMHVQSPLELTVGSVNLEIGEYVARLKCGEDGRPTSQALKKDLLSYSPWYEFIFTPWITTLTLIPLWIGLDLFLGIALSDSFLFVSLAALAATSSILALDWKIRKPKIFYRLRDNFFQRNSDKIVLMLLAATIGFGVARLENILFFFSTE